MNCEAAFPYEYALGDERFSFRRKIIVPWIRIEANRSFLSLRKVRFPDEELPADFPVTGTSIARGGSC